MQYIFLDESGDLGFNFGNKKTSKNFIITILITDDKNKINKIIKKIFKTLPKKILKNHGNVLHAYKESPRTRKKLLKLISQNNIISFICLNKTNLNKPDRNEIYTNMIVELIKTLLDKKIVSNNTITFLILSRRETNKLLNSNLIYKLKEEFKDSTIDIQIKTPHQEKGLQVVDTISWVVFRKYEHKDSSYYNLIEKMIIIKIEI